MDFQPDVVAAGVETGGKAQRGAVAGADFHHLGGVAAKQCVQVTRLAAVVDAEPWPGLVERTLLGRGEAALAQHEAAYGAVAFFHGEGFGRRFGTSAVERVGHQISPSTGEDALA